MMRSPLGNRRVLANGNIVSVVIFFFILFFVIGTPVRAPFRSVAVFLVSPLWSLGMEVSLLTQKLFPSIFSGMELVEENRMLNEEIASLRVEHWRAEIIKNERDALRGLLGRSTTTEDHFLLAYVLATPNFTPYDTLVLDVGEDTGIFLGAKVMTDGGFVIGIITEVLPTRSIAQLYSSPGLRHDVIVGSARIPAIAHGIGGGNYRIELPKNIDITEGDEVSILGGVEEFLGVIERSIIDEKTGIMTLFLRLPINMTELRSVIVDLSPSP
jgi:cell shape-determining protein MreC